jgi:hypothetical protein
VRFAGEATTRHRLATVDGAWSSGLREAQARMKPYQRAKPAPIDVNYRMAYVGTVSVIDDKGEALVTRRSAAEPDTEPEDIVNRMMAW